MVDSTWLHEQRVNLIQFGREGYDDVLGGFGRLQADGSVLRNRGLETWANSRAVYCFCLDVLAGNDASREDAEKAAKALQTLLADPDHGGWFSGVDERGEPHQDGRKEAYTHAFVLLAASSLIAINSEFGSPMFRQVEATIEDKFWVESESATSESWNRDWTEEEPYRGANSNMHLTEASLAAFDVTGDEKWLKRATGIVGKIIGEFAASSGWRIPEHFNEAWIPSLSYNIDEPQHPFRPFGATPGHGFEWARLVIQLKVALENTGHQAPGWLPVAAEGLFSQALEDGWSRNSEPGFCYTVDFDGRVVTPLHLAWVACEALSAAIVLEKATGKTTYLTWQERLWRYCEDFLVDREYGGWLTELDENNRPSAEIWGDKPDFYHPLQTILFPGTPIRPSLLTALGGRN